MILFFKGHMSGTVLKCETTISLRVALLRGNSRLCSTLLYLMFHGLKDCEVQNIQYFIEILWLDECLIHVT